MDKKFTLSKLDCLYYVSVRVYDGCADAGPLFFACFCAYLASCIVNIRESKLLVCSLNPSYIFPSINYFCIKATLIVLFTSHTPSFLPWLGTSCITGLFPTPVSVTSCFHMFATVRVKVGINLSTDNELFTVNWFQISIAEISGSHKYSVLSTVRFGCLNFSCFVAVLERFISYWARFDL
jgi:hypothetical protein